MSDPTALLFFLLAGFGLYFLPYLVAAFRGVQRTVGILVLNFFAGWTLIGWVAALVWAVQADTDQDLEHKAKEKSADEARIARAVAAALEAERLKAQRSPQPPRPDGSE